MRPLRLSAVFTQLTGLAELAAGCGDCGESVKVGVDFLGNDVGTMSEQPSLEDCCEFCRVTNEATAWTYSTGNDYPKGCWCKTQESHNPNCVPPNCMRVSGNITPPCFPWGWVFMISLAISAVAYTVIGTAYNAQVYGKDELPNVEFWAGLSSLVRDGVAYTVNAAASTAQGRVTRKDYSEVDRVDTADSAKPALPTEVEPQAQKAVGKFRKKSKPSKIGPRTRLMEASIIGSKKTAKELLRDKEAKAELNCGDQRGATAFHHACGTQPPSPTTELVMHASVAASTVFLQVG
jgi:hypothetical protein